MSPPEVARSIREGAAQISGELDPRIAPLVRLMLKLGFDTVSSCDGHFRDGRVHRAKANVVFRALDRGLLHSWVREVSRTDMPLPVEFCMFPTWDPDRDVVHEDNWIVWLDASDCVDVREAETKRNRTVRLLLVALQRAAKARPLAVDAFVRSRW